MIIIYRNMIKYCRYSLLTDFYIWVKVSVKIYKQVEDKMKQVSVVGIAGGTASGKSTIVSQRKEVFKDDIELICHDSYYKANDDKTIEERQN